jgi:hypothetical protein
MSRKSWLGHATCAVLIAASTPAFALMSPYYESLTVVQRILGDPSLADSLKQQAILSVVQTAPDVWQIKSAECTISVNVVDVPAPANEPAMVGGRNFDVKFGTPSCQ